MQSTLQLLRDMIAIPSVNPMGAANQSAEKGMANFIENVLNGARIDCERQTVSEGRDNLIAIVHSTESDVNGIMLNSHMDTVPVDNMSIKPFDPVIENGRVFGRGSCDAKASIAAMMSALIEYANQPHRPRPAVFAAMADEEFGFSGSWKLTEKSWPVSACVVGEPTLLTRVIAHKGIVRWRIAVDGLSAHGAEPELGRNAVYDGARVALALEEYAQRLAEKQPHPRLGHSTLNVGRVAGGHAVNIVPDKCVFELECRLLPGEDGQQAVTSCEHFLRDRLPESVQLTFESPYLIDPAMETEPEAEIVEALARAQQDELGFHRELAGANYGTDGSKLSRAGIQTVVCGPGDIAQAHTANEFVEITQLELATRMYSRLLANWNAED
ncbi:MAG TPA: M20 family metallopeptidase [Pyrinomonadaceae bacterium]|nr:M20 family metallopeptidase [Pyrinomonadaceae bacterium]